MNSKTQLSNLAEQCRKVSKLASTIVESDEGQDARGITKHNLMAPAKRGYYAALRGALIFSTGSGSTVFPRSTGG
jgi:hypothetical protein